MIHMFPQGVTLKNKHSVITDFFTKYDTVLQFEILLWEGHSMKKIDYHLRHKSGVLDVFWSQKSNI